MTPAKRRETHVEKPEAGAARVCRRPASPSRCWRWQKAPARQRMRRARAGCTLDQDRHSRSSFRAETHGDGRAVRDRGRQPGGMTPRPARWRASRWARPMRGLIRAQTGFGHRGGVAPVGHLTPIRAWFDPRLLEFEVVLGRRRHAPPCLLPFAPDVLLRLKRCPTPPISRPESPLQITDRTRGVPPAGPVPRHPGPAAAMVSAMASSCSSRAPSCPATCSAPRPPVPGGTPRPEIRDRAACRETRFDQRHRIDAQHRRDHLRLSQLMS